MLPILTDLRHARVMQSSLEDLVEEGNYCKVYSFFFSGIRITIILRYEFDKKPEILFYIL